MKKWILAATATLLLTACSAETSEDVQTEAIAETFSSVIEDNTITVTRVISPNEDVQSVIDVTDPSTFASFIYSMYEESYLLINSNDAVTVTASDTDTTLQLHLSHDEASNEKTTSNVYAISFSHQYDTIQLFENGEEIPFDIWTE